MRLFDVAICVSGSVDAHPENKLIDMMMSEIEKTDIPNACFIDLKWQCIKKPRLKPSGVYELLLESL